MIRRPPRSTQSRSSAASDVYKRQLLSLAELYSAEGDFVSAQRLLSQLPGTGHDTDAENYRTLLVEHDGSTPATAAAVRAVTATAEAGNQYRQHETSSACTASIVATARKPTPGGPDLPLREM